MEDLIPKEQFATVHIVITVGEDVYTYDLPRISDFKVEVKHDPPPKGIGFRPLMLESNPVKSIVFSMKPHSIDDSGVMMWFKQPNTDRDLNICTTEGE